MEIPTCIIHNNKRINNPDNNSNNTFNKDTLFALLTLSYTRKLANNKTCYALYGSVYYF